LTTQDNAADTAAEDSSRPRRRSQPDQPPPKSAAQQVGSVAKELIFILVGAIIVSSLLRAFVGQMFIIPSQSMENTLLVGDRVVVQKITDFHRGEVVVFQDPGGWLSEGPSVDAKPFDRVLEFIGVPTKSTPGHLIKRVIGMPGDRVVCCDSQGRLTVNGYPLDEKNYLYTDPSGAQVSPSDVQFEVVVPKDRIFVMGDHRDLSADSRCHLSDLSTSQAKGEVAFVPIDLVVGSALAVVAPFNRAARLRDQATFAGVPAAKDPPPAEAVIKPEGVTC
jgi:signal peptidase I